jgi:ATP-dependent DNA ligase
LRRPWRAVRKDGIACFDHIRYRRHDGRVFLYAFDLIELDGEDMRRDPLAVRRGSGFLGSARPSGGTQCLP